ncbi:aspartate aminotransferase family protein [Mycolicibacterium setense]
MGPHGNAHPAIVEAAQRAMRDGMAFGLPNMLEIDHARVILDRLGYVDQIRYTNSGTEALMLAVRLARAATGRDVVIFMRRAYHGHSDVALVPGGAHSRRGVPDGVTRDAVEVAPNDTQALAAAFDAHRGRIAAVIIDPLPNRAGLVAIDLSCWQAARKLCDETGALLVSDEVISLRLAYQGAAMALGIVPDLITMGKIIGGGTPVGAVAGTADHMAILDPLRRDGLKHGGTFSGNPLTMAAGIASMRLFTAAEVDRLNALGHRLRCRLAAGVEDYGWEVRGAGSLFRPYPRDTTPERTRAAHEALWWAAYDTGVLLTQGCQGALSTPMDDTIVDEIAECLVAAVAAVAESVPA